MSFSTYFEIAFLLLLAIILILIAIWTIINGISPMPTADKTKRALLQALPEKIAGTIVDLGSGWATLALALAKKYPNNAVIGYETSPIPYLFSKLLCIRHKNLHVERKDFFTVDLSNTALVVCYLYPKAMKRLEKKLRAELTDKTLIASHTFSFNTLAIEKTIAVNDLYKTKIYFFRVP